MQHEKSDERNGKKGREVVWKHSESQQLALLKYFAFGF